MNLNEVQTQAPTFEDWMERVDRCLIKVCDLTSDDLADQTWRDWYDAGMSPRNAAQDALDNEGWDLDEALED